jgi:hypothetical protein
VVLEGRWGAHPKALALSLGRVTQAGANRGGGHGDPGGRWRTTNGILTLTGGSHTREEGVSHPWISRGLMKEQCAECRGRGEHPAPAALFEVGRGGGMSRSS